MLAIVASLVIDDHGQTGAIFFMMNESDMQAALKSPLVSICTNKSHPVGGELVREFSGVTCATSI